MMDGVAPSATNQMCQQESLYILLLLCSMYIFYLAGKFFGKCTSHKYLS